MDKEPNTKQINYNFFHWGPFLYKTKLTDEEVDQIKSLCNKKKKKDYRKNLAGLIKHEYTIDTKKLFPIIYPYLDSYSKAYFNYSGKIMGKKIKLNSSWVNYMTKFESNPLHTHDEDYSFVIYTNIPEELKKEYEDTISNSRPGKINFIIDFAKQKSINSHAFFPDVGDFFIFPANLHHYVDHFKSDGERISVSGNLKVE
jgi:uncharacterized protein (TIGR02466 family)